MFDLYYLNHFSFTLESSCCHSSFVIPSLPFPNFVVLCLFTWHIFICSHLMLHCFTWCFMSDAQSWCLILLSVFYGQTQITQTPQGHTIWLQLDKLLEMYMWIILSWFLLNFVMSVLQLDFIIFYLSYQGVPR